MTQPDPLLTPAQVVEKLAAQGVEISEESVRAWTRTRKIRFVRLPSGRLFFRETDVNSFLTTIEPADVA